MRMIIESDDLTFEELSALITWDDKVAWNGLDMKDLADELGVKNMEEAEIATDDGEPLPTVKSLRIYEED